MVPTSGISGEGISDILLLIIQMTCDPRGQLRERIMFNSVLQATVMEVKVVEGHGTTIDVLLVNGEIKSDDTIVVCGLNGPIVTQIRALMTTAPMQELRVKNAYTVRTLSG